MPGRVARCVDIALICDADTGYGNVVNVARTVAEFEAAGVAAIHMEDQVSPKRCAQMAGARTVLDFDESVAKVAAAVAARIDPDFLVIAWTGNAESLGLDRGQFAVRALLPGQEPTRFSLKSRQTRTFWLRCVWPGIRSVCRLSSTWIRAAHCAPCMRKG